MGKKKSQAKQPKVQTPADEEVRSEKHATAGSAAPDDVAQDKKPAASGPEEDTTLNGEDSPTNGTSDVEEASPDVSASSEVEPAVEAAPPGEPVASEEDEGEMVDAAEAAEEEPVPVVQEVAPAPVVEDVRVEEEEKAAAVGVKEEEVQARSEEGAPEAASTEVEAEAPQPPAPVPEPVPQTDVTSQVAAEEEVNGREEEGTVEEEKTEVVQEQPPQQGNDAEQVVGVSSEEELVAGEEDPEPAASTTTEIEADTTSTEGAGSSSEPMPTPAAAPVEPIEVGEEVECTWGSGIVKEIRADGVHVVTAERWRLANDQQPTFYLQRKDVTKITPYVIWQWKTPKKLARASHLKEKGNSCFKANDLEGAESKYSEAIAVLQQLTVDEGMDNREKAMKLEILLPLLNNASTVRLKLDKSRDALLAARSTYQLIEELKKNRDGRVMEALRELGVSDDQVFVKHLKKAAFCCGRATLKLQEYGDAISFFETARSLVPLEAEMGIKSTDGVELARLLKQARELKKQQDRAEKNKWSKTFAKFSQEEEEMDASTSSNKDVPAPSTAPPADEPKEVPVIKPVRKSRALSKPDPVDSGAADASGWYLTLAGVLAVGLGAAYFFGRKRN